MEPYTFQTFLKDLNLPPKISLEEFKTKFKKRINDNDDERTINVYEYLSSLPETDFRNAKSTALWGEENARDEIIQAFYKIFVSNREDVLEQWFNQHIKLKSKGFYQQMQFDKRLLVGDTFTASVKDTYGRFVKNIHYKDVFNTAKMSSKGRETVVDGFLNAFSTYQGMRNICIPMYIKKVLKYDLKDLFAIFRGTLTKASIFNPYFAGYLFNDFLKSEKIFTPVLGWSSYALGAINCPKVKEYVGTDVIPSVCEKTDNMFKYYKSKIKHKIYCCPDEEMDKRHNFSNEYKDHFDTIFFSPPYFDCELYKGGEQSHVKFSQYEQWLEGYWRPTMELCKNVLQPGGKMAFVISDYKSGPNNWIEISEDLRRIGAEYLTFEKDYKVVWNSQKKLGGKMAEGNFENLYLFTK